MIQSYKRTFKTEEKYDTIVNGSGIGGLTAAAFYPKKAKSFGVGTTLYGREFTHIFKRNGYEWDEGIHYIGEVQRPNSAIRRMFDYISDGKLNGLIWEGL